MIRRAVLLLLVVAVPVGTIVLAGLGLVFRNDWAKRRLHETVAVQLAQTLDAEVRVGDISGDLVLGFTIRDLAISDGRSFADGTLATADSTHIKANLWAAFHKGTPPIEAVEEVRVVGLHGRLARGPDGKLNIDRFLPKAKPSKAPSKARFRGCIIVEGAELDYTDQAPRPAALTGLELRLTNIDASADFARRDVVEVALRADGAAAPFARVEASGSYAQSSRALSVNATVTGARLPELYNRFVHSPAAHVQSGVVNAVGNACFVPGELVDFAVAGHAGGISAEVAALQGERVLAQADFLATPAGVELRNIRAEALGATITAAGAVFDLAAPTLDITASAANVDLDRCARLAPETVNSLPKVSGARDVRLHGRITGPLTDPDITVAAQFPSKVGVEYVAAPRQESAEGQEPRAPTTATAEASGLVLTASVPDIRTQDAFLQVSAAELSTSDLGVFLPDQQYLSKLQPAPLRNLKVEIAYSRKTAATGGRLTIEEIDTEHGPIRGVQVRYALLGRTVRAEASADDVLGGQVAANGLLDFSGERAYAYAEFDSSHVDLAALADAAGSEGHDVQGQAGASGVVALRDGKFEAAADVTARGARVDAVELDSVHAYLGATDEALDVRYATATSPLGALWARGTVPFEGPAELEVTVADVPLAQAQAVAQQPRPDQAPDQADETPEAEPVQIAGRAFAHGWVRGELRAPQVTADVAVFGGGVGEVTTEAVTASVEATPQEVSITNLLARRGTAVLSGVLTISDIIWPEGAFFAGKSAPEGDEEPPAPSAIDGRLGGFAEVRGVDLAQIDEFVELPADVRVGGVVEADVQVNGTLRDPQVGGSVSATHLKAAQETGDVAVGPVEFAGVFAADRDKVRLTEGLASSDAGSLTVSGEVSGWHAEEGPSVVARFDARDLPLSAYTPADGPAALVEGTVDRLTGTLAGPLGKPGPTVKARLAAREVRFGRRQARNIETDLSYCEGVLAANNLTCDGAGGGVKVRAASYRPSDQKIFADLTGSDLDAQQLLFLAADLASQGREDRDSVALRDRIYSYGHRLRGKLSAKQIVVGGHPEGLEGRVAGLSAQQTSLDRKTIPGLTADFHFAGLALRTPGGEPPAEEAERPIAPSLAHLRVDGLRVTSDPIGEGVILVHGEDIAKGATVDLDGDVDLVAEADLVPVGAINDWLPRDLDLGGDLSFTVKAKGPVDDPQVWSSFEVFGPTVAGVQFDLLQAAYVEVQSDAIVLTGGLLKSGANEAQVHGSLPFDREHLKLNPDGPVSFEARMDDLPPSVLLELADEFAAKPVTPDAGPSLWKQAQATGLITAWLKVAGKLRQPEVTGGVSVEQGATFRMASWSKDSTICDIGGDLLLGKSPTGIGATVEALNIRGRWQDTQFALEGRAEVSRLAPDELLKNRIDELTFTADAEKQRFPGGTIAKNLKAVVKARTDPEGWHVLTVEEGAAQLGGGTATLTGAALLDTLHLSELGSMPCDLRLALDKAQMRYGRMMDRAQVDGTIVARKFASRTRRPLPEVFLAARGPADSLDPSAPAVIATALRDSPGEPGWLEVTRASLGIPRRKEPTEPEGAVPQTPEPRRGRHLYGLPSYLPSPRLNVQVALGHSVVFDTSIARGDVVPDPKAVRLTGTPQAPQLVASASMRGGSLRLLRGNLGVPDAGLKVEVSPAPYVSAQRLLRRELAMKSELWGRAEGTVSGTTLTGENIGPIHVQLELSGGLPPNHVLTASANPPLTSSEVYELLAVAPLRPGDQASPDRSQTIDEMLAGAVASRVFSGVLEPLEQELSEALGLEQLQVTVGLNQPVEFRVGKYLIKDLLVSYMRTAGGPEEQFDLRVSYKVSDKLQVSWDTDERSDSRVAVEYRWQF